MCLSPKWIYKKGNYKQDNYRGMQGDFYEIGTYTKCGACAQCVAEKSNNWVIRNWYEAKRNVPKSFITLTYAENPIILVRKDVQDFMKRLRRYLDYREEEKVRMFQNGEYGILNGRPHFHILLYNWEDKNAKYLGINRKKQIVYQSEIIQKVWGLGRTSYQSFSTHEIPYVSLYNTPQETFKRAYKMTRQKLKTLTEYAHSHNFEENQRRNLLIELNEIQKKMDLEKSKYYLIKEFNSWSQALGWEEFEKEYYKSKEYTFTEYIENCQYATPTPWIKRLANMGDIAAAQEMYRREEMLIQSANEDEERIKNILKMNDRRKKELREWNDKKDEIEYL